MRLEIDENGYLYLVNVFGEKRYILVDVPNCAYYGKLMLGAPIKEVSDD